MLSLETLFKSQQTAHSSQTQE